MSPMKKYQMNLGLNYSQLVGVVPFYVSFCIFYHFLCVEHLLSMIVHVMVVESNWFNK